MGNDPDDTVRLKPARSPARPAARVAPPPPVRTRSPLVAVAVIGLPFVLAAGIGGWLLLGPSTVPPAAPPPVALPQMPAPAPVALPRLPPVPAAPTTPAPRLPVEVRPLAAIEAAVDPVTRFSRLAENRDVLVIGFATLAEQGATLNRIAAFIEKAGQPRDRVLNDFELASATAPSPETYYLGHDYSAASLRRFFAYADRDGIRLNAAEEKLRGLLAQEGMLAEGATGALVSVAAPGPEMDAAARRAVLWHESSHGEYFTRPAYAEWTQRFWQEKLSEAERDAFRRFLARLDYDPADEELMANETQAFLMHTPDPRFFSPTLVGLPVETVTRLQSAFRAGMPDGWLKGGAR